MKTRIQNLLESVLKESMITRDDILTAIEKGKIIVISKDGENSTSLKSVIPIEIDDEDNIIGTTDDGDEVSFNINQIVSMSKELEEGIDISKTNDPAVIKKVADVEGGVIPMKGDTINKMDTGAVQNLVDKADKAKVDVQITESEESLPQEQGLQNLISWCEKLDLNLRDKTEIGNKIKFITTINGTPVNIYIESDGAITMGGQSIESEDEMKRLMQFFEDVR